MSGTSKHFRSYVERLNTTVLRSCVSRSADKQMAEIRYTFPYSRTNFRN